MKISANAILTTKNRLKLPINGDKRVFVVGDLDADFKALNDALVRVSFDPASDLLICLGDVIDRGVDSVRLLEYLQEIGAVIVLGNHEHIMIESILGHDETAKSLWVQNGGGWHLNESPKLLRSLCQFLLKQPLSVVLEYQSHKIGLSHTLPTDWDWNHKQDDKRHLVASLLWDRDRVKKRKHIQNLGVDFSIHGHNSTQVPFWIANTYHIDTSYYGRPTLVELSEVIKKYTSLKVKQNQ
ncbi:metallophosphoesterase [Pseudoalteromonas aurantia]|uniref:Metallophosphoesterase n=1 Tax=Pseudoalteromonas aurantia TaxID=43654 RepID=A0A5S3V298_9GAMM|nr:metallophosphoesterase [Pseudoalteromonas aurantia]TMO64870.1 metallophosphoesterase [Pseudoalteromonas aurantia]